MKQPQYHTHLRPEDSEGNSLKPLDIVIIQEVPEHYWQEPDSRNLREFAGCYGLLNYAIEYGEGQPYHLDNPDHPGWVSRDGSVVRVVSRCLRQTEIVTCEFWLPPRNLKKIQFNSFVLNIFSEYPWQMREDDGPGSYFFLKSGLSEFEYLKKIMSTPIHVLNEAHMAAMKIIDAEWSSRVRSGDT
jgi:hypothetical protein